MNAKQQAQADFNNLKNDIYQKLANIKADLDSRDLSNDTYSHLADIKKVFDDLADIELFLGIEGRKIETLRDILMNGCNDICQNPDCKKAIRQYTQTGRWYITMGHAGFNSTANNGNGYASKASAYRAMCGYINATK